MFHCTTSDTGCIESYFLPDNQGRINDTYIRPLMKPMKNTLNERTIKGDVGKLYQLLAASPPILNDAIKADALIEGVICYLSRFSESRCTLEQKSLILCCPVARQVAACVLVGLPALLWLTSHTFALVSVL